MSYAAPRQVAVRYFASLAERTGTSREVVELGGEVDVAALWRRLVALHPALDGLSFRPLVACDMAWSDWDRSLAGVDEVAFLPPVSGG